MLELMVASVIMLLLLTMLFAAAAAITGSWERLNVEREHFSAVMTLDRTLDTMLSNVIPFRWRDSENAPIGSFQGTFERVAFVYRHRLNTVNDGALRNVVLFLEDNTFYAVYQARPFLDLYGAPGPNAETAVLAEDIERVEFQYADWDSEQSITWTDEWNPEGERLDVPPGVRIDVFWQDGYQESWLRRTAGSGFDEQLGDWEEVL